MDTLSRCLLLLPMLLLFPSGSSSRSITAPMLVGHYVAGAGGFGVAGITLCQDGTFTAGGSSDVVSNIFDASGTYRVHHNTLLLTSTKSSGQPDFRWKRLHVCQIVPWGLRLYLVESSDKLRFCNAVNLGDEPAGNVLTSDFYLREGDDVKRVSGLPQVPRQWASYMFRHPVIGRVLAVRGIQVKEQTGVRAASMVTINIGRHQGLKPGMQFWIDKPRNYVQITQVKATQSVAQVDSPSASIKVGALVSSQLPARRREQVQRIVPREKIGGAVH